MKTREYVVGRARDIPEGQGVAVRAGRHDVALFRIDDSFYAVHNRCPHKGGLLCRGDVMPERAVVRCPWHMWNWDLKTGELDTDPRQKLRRYGVRVEDGDVILRI